MEVLEGSVATSEAPAEVASPAATTPEGQGPELAAPQDEFRYRTEQGSVYRDENALFQGVIEKDAYIERLHRELAAARVTPAPTRDEPVSPAKTQDEWAAELDFAVRDFLSEGYNQEDAVRAAKILINRERRQEQRFDKKLQERDMRTAQQSRAEQLKAEYAGIQQAYPLFDINRDPVAMAVFDEAPNLTPKQHLRMWCAEKGIAYKPELLAGAARFTSPSANAALARAQATGRPQYPSIGAGGTRPAQPAGDAWVESQTQQHVKELRSFYGPKWTEEQYAKEATESRAKFAHMKANPQSHSGA